jgi:TolB protein
MANKNKNHYPIDSQPDRVRRRLSIVSRLLLLIINVVILAFLGWNAWMAGLLNAYLPENYQIFPTEAAPPQIEPTSPTIVASPTAESTPTATSTALPTQISEGIPQIPGIIVLSINQAGYNHLFAFHPTNLPLTRLTYGQWDDLSPALSPDGTRVAFVSNREGHWDIYVLDLYSGMLNQVTDDLAYEGSPSWSPDGVWLAYEKYVDANLDIYMQTVDHSIAETRITSHGAADFDPAWHPGGSLIAFTSTRTGASDILVADIDQLGKADFVENFTFNTTLNQTAPTWSPDGSQLAYATPHQGYPSIYIADYAQGSTSAEYLANGSAVQWSPDGSELLVLQQTPEATFLTVLHAASHSYLLPPFMLDGRISQISWGADLFPETLPSSIQQAAQANPSASWQIELTPDAGTLYGRQNVIELPDLDAPYPSFIALAIEPFYALKDRTEQALGWDLLSELENAFIPISTSLPPGRAQDWLYTGRAFALNSVLYDLEWMLVSREDYGSQTYWRIFIKTLAQDGTQGKPLTAFPWIFSTRQTNSTAFQQGGEQVSVLPEGYWLDFTTLAGDYGWQRFPSLVNWQSYYQGTRFNLFAITSGLTWEDAMLQLWPPEFFNPQP